jgi:uncharacterized protein YqeY
MDLTELKAEILVSLKSGNASRTLTLRSLLSDVRYAAIAKYKAEWETLVTAEDVLDVVRRQIKTHKESIEMFSKAGRTDLVDKETVELKILEAYLPPQMSDAELSAIVSGVMSTGETNFGKLMGMVMAKTGKSVDGSKVASIIKSLLPK